MRSTSPYKTSTGPLSTILDSGMDLQLSSVSVAYTSTATVGNRQVVLQILNPSNQVIAQFSAGMTQAASLVRRYNFSNVGVREAAAVNGEVVVPIPKPLLLNAGFTLKVYDSAAIDINDTMAVGIMAVTVN